MSTRDREIRGMIERAWQEQEKKEQKERDQKGFLNFHTPSGAPFAAASHEGVRVMKTRTTLVVLSMLSLFLLPGQAESLSILLTNEEGWDTPGIQTMKEALTSAGHEVTLVAPSSARTRSGTSFIEGPVSVTQESPNEYAVDATPATCVVLGFSLIGHAPDLVISGTHSRTILGSTALHSGTVGAAMTAINPQLTGTSVPAMTFSTGFSSAGRVILVGADLRGYDWFDRTISPEQNDYTEVADFAVGLIAHLENEARFGEDLLPPGVGLNVNYPLVPEEKEIRGVQIAVQGRSMTESPIFYQQSEPGVFVPSPGRRRSIREVLRADTIAFGQGFITVVPFTANFSVDGDITLALELALQALMPPNQTGPMMNNDCNGDGVINGLDLLLGSCGD